MKPTVNGTMKCNSLANTTVSITMSLGTNRDFRQLLSSKDLVVFVDNKTPKRDLRKSGRYKVGKRLSSKVS